MKKKKSRNGDFELEKLKCVEEEEDKEEGKKQNCGALAKVLGGGTRKEDQREHRKHRNPGKGRGKQKKVPLLLNVSLHL